MLFFVIIVEEHLIFRPKLGYILDGWDNPKALPVGLASMLAFWIGVAGCVIGMGQTWYVGPIAKMIGEFGGDLGIEIGFVFSGIAYPGLRWLELKKFGR